MAINVSLKMWILGFMKGVFLVNFNLYGDQGGVVCENCISSSC